MFAIVLVLGFLCLWSIYKIVVYALPCLLGFGVGSLALSTGAGWVGTILTGLAVAVGSFFLLRLFLSTVRSDALRLSIALVLVLPTAVLAYNVGIDALASSVPAEFWRQTLSIGFALGASAIAFVRLAEFDAVED